MKKQEKRGHAAFPPPVVKKFIELACPAIKASNGQMNRDRLASVPVKLTKYLQVSGPWCFATNESLCY